MQTLFLVPSSLGRSVGVGLEGQRSIFPKVTIADAIMDRLIHNAHRIELKGGSMRKKQKLDGH